MAIATQNCITLKNYLHSAKLIKDNEYIDIF